ncbi:twin-arginine translocase subunit TatC [Salibacter sp.]|jgi:sec-independent protein translocase protein TatC|uniref:twin-arginine translocase subunit TatC n=1 Tax=Salibacter sp. TaxID=2010995 RepID=UPI002870499D|nr:twin-arginine translocase subunit TatC [Salibacter sp.]MDR9399044.1 twin-arginine translocase subunit TatC [Salibacter sp.]MDR9488091.1 twin-arginine translocase subunit TatC [Salibacter sp.]
MAKKLPQHEESEMSFLDHLEELRWHLVRGSAAIIIGAILVFANKSFIFDGIIFAPKSPDFWTFQKLCSFSHWLNTSIPQLFRDADLLCIGQDIPKLQNISMTGQFTSHILVSIIAGLVIAFPYLIWELWRFIKPGLQPSERKMTRGLVFFTSLLFFTGVLFGYYVIAPLSINFLSTYSVSEAVQTIPTLRTYITTVTTVVLASGILFELPILVYFLTKIGLITPQFLRKYRRHFIVIALIIAAIITPPDLFSQILVCLPLMILYEISILLSIYITKKEAKKEQAS